MSRLAISGTINQRKIKPVKDPTTNNAFITSWAITENNFVFTYPTAYYDGGLYDYYLDWGDGSTEEHFTDDTPPTHLYAQAGEYQISARGSLPRFGFIDIESDLNFIGDPSLLLGVDGFGDVGFRSMAFMFALVDDIYIPNILTGNEQVTNMFGMFIGSSFNQDIGGGM